MIETMPAVSVVVTAPVGFSKCMIPQWLLDRADGRSLELIVPDNKETGAGREGFNHLALPGEHVFALRRKGIATARHPWVILMEDHTIPMPDAIEQLREAIARHPDADIIAGAVENLTSTAPQSWAHFLRTAYRFWPQSRRGPEGGASISLMAIRKGAIMPDELATDGGFEVLTLARLIKTGRTRFVPAARVNHVQAATLLTHCLHQFHNARCHAVFMRQFGRSWLRSAAAESVFALHATFVSPFRILFSVRGTPQFNLSLLPRIFSLGAFMGAGRLRGLWGDLGRSPYCLD